MQLNGPFDNFKKAGYRAYRLIDGDEIHKRRLTSSTATSLSDPQIVRFYREDLLVEYRQKSEASSSFCAFHLPLAEKALQGTAYVLVNNQPRTLALGLAHETWPDFSYHLPPKADGFCFCDGQCWKVTICLPLIKQVSAAPQLLESNTKKTLSAVVQNHRVMSHDPLLGKLPSGFASYLAQSANKSWPLTIRRAEMTRWHPIPAMLELEPETQRQGWNLVSPLNQAWTLYSTEESLQTISVPVSFQVQLSGSINHAAWTVLKVGIGFNEEPPIEKKVVLLFYILEISIPSRGNCSVRRF